MTDSKPSPLEIDVERDDAGATITVSGEIDLETSGALHDALSRALRSAPPCTSTCRSVEYMDSTGLRTVLVAKGEIERAGGSLDVDRRVEHRQPA